MNKISSLIKKIPGIRLLYDFIRLIYYLVKTHSVSSILFAPPGHFYSPLPDKKNVKNNEDFLFNRDKNNCHGIDLREQAQRNLIDNFSTYYHEIPFTEESEGTYRYFYKNPYFGYGDVIISLWCRGLTIIIISPSDYRTVIFKN